MLHRTPSSPTPAALVAFRGDNRPAPLSARGITASLEVPGCIRRAVFDAAGIPLDRMAPLLDCPPGEQAAHAFRRGNQFENRVMENNAAELIALLRRHLALAIDQVRVVDLSAEQVRIDHGTNKNINQVRARRTRQYLERMLADEPDAPTLLRHAMTTLTIGETTAYLEQDALAVVADGAVHVIEMKSFPKLDGRADPVKADAARRQSAVYALSLLQTAAELGLPDTAVSMNALLVIPENFSLNPVAHVVDLTRQVRRLRHQLAQRPTEAELAELLPTDATLPDLRTVPKQEGPERNAAKARTREVFTTLPYRFGDGCMACPVFQFCREEAQRTNAVAQLGTAAVNACGSVTSISTALDLAHGQRQPENEGEQALADALARAVAVGELAVGA
jgi:hypothetical protein